MEQVQPSAAGGANSVEPQREPTGAAATHPRQSEPVATTALDENSIRGIICGLLHQDRDSQRELIERWFTDDVRFIHFLGSTCGKDKVFKVYRLATVTMKYKVDFVESVIAQDKAVVWCNLHVTPTLLPFMGAVTFPALILMHFVHDPATGSTKINLQYDHHSLYVFTSAWGHPAQWLSRTVLLPMGGRLLVWLGGWADRLSVAVERRLGIRLGSKAPCSGGAGGTVVVEPPCPPGADGGTTQKKLE